MKRGWYKHHYFNHFELHPLHLQQETHTHKRRTHDKKENTNLKNQKQHGRVQTWRGCEEKLEYKLTPLSLGGQPLAIIKSYNYNYVLEALEINHGLCHNLGWQ